MAKKSGKHSSKSGSPRYSEKYGANRPNPYMGGHSEDPRPQTESFGGILFSDSAEIKPISSGDAKPQEVREETAQHSPQPRHTAHRNDQGSKRRGNSRSAEHTRRAVSTEQEERLEQIRMEAAKEAALLKAKNSESSVFGLDNRKDGGKLVFSADGKPMIAVEIADPQTGEKRTVMLPVAMAEEEVRGLLAESESKREELKKDTEIKEQQEKEESSAANAQLSENTQSETDTAEAACVESAEVDSAEEKEPVLIPIAGLDDDRLHNSVLFQLPVMPLSELDSEAAGGESDVQDTTDSVGEDITKDDTVEKEDNNSDTAAAAALAGAALLVNGEDESDDHSTENDGEKPTDSIDADGADNEENTDSAETVDGEGEDLSIASDRAVMDDHCAYDVPTAASAGKKTGKKRHSSPVTVIETLGDDNSDNSADDLPADSENGHNDTENGDGAEGSDTPDNGAEATDAHSENADAQIGDHGTDKENPDGSAEDNTDGADKDIADGAHEKANDVQADASDDVKTYTGNANAPSGKKGGKKKKKRRPDAAKLTQTQSEVPTDAQPTEQSEDTAQPIFAPEENDDDMKIVGTPEEIEARKKYVRPTASAVMALSAQEDDSDPQDDGLFIKKERPGSTTAVFELPDGVKLPAYINDDDFLEQWLEEGDDMAIKDKKHRRRVSALIGAMTMVFAVIGFIWVLQYTFSSLSSIGSTDTQKAEYEKYITPVVMSEVEPFETWDAIGQDKLLQSAVFQVLTSMDQSQYALDDTNKLIIPSNDVLAAARALYGSEATIQLENLNAVDSEDVYYSDIDDSFHVAATGINGPQPVVTSMSKNGSTITLTVGYKDELDTGDGDNYLYVRQFLLTVTDDGYYIKAIREASQES